MEGCPHNIKFSGLCGDCGQPIQSSNPTSVSMIHSIPELKVTEQYAKEIGKADQERLMRDRKLVLLVDLDQTILHTTHEKVCEHPHVHSFTLWPGHPTYYTKLRPHLKEFLEQMSKIYELHIFTFGCRLYADKIASIIDPDKRYFGNRILSRDESVDQYSKRGNLSNLFPCGDAMVCIIDDRADVWRDAGNLIQVKPYSYFKTSISDGALLSNKPTLDDEDESLDDEVGALEDLLGLQSDSVQEDERGEPSESAEKQGVDSPEDELGAAKGRQMEEEDKKPTTSQSQDTESEPKRADDSSRPEDESSGHDDQSDHRPGTPQCHLEEDTDEHLLHLPSILSRIHEKWYMELDEQRQFLVDGENYKLPDIKDIISRYLRKKYN